MLVTDRYAAVIISILALQSSYLVVVGPDAAAISMTVPAEQVDVKVVLRSLLLTTPERLQHVVFLSTGLQGMPKTVHRPRKCLQSCFSLQKEIPL